MGKYIQPYINIVSDSTESIQYIERGAKGIRYLNISQVMSENTTKLRLFGNHVSIEDQTVQLITFKNRDIKKSKILVIAPHPDDAEIAAYGLYSDNRKSYILTITAGDAGRNKYDEIYRNRKKQYIKKGEIRTWNSITVPMLGGIPPEQSVNLGFFDGTLKTMFENKSKAATGLYTGISDITFFRKKNISSISSGLSGKSDWNSLVTNIEYILKTVEPNIIIAPYPALDNHYDHKLSSVALFEAIKKIGIKEGFLYLYTNQLEFNAYYPYGKMGGVLSIPPNFTKNNVYFDGIYSHTLSVNKQKDKILALEAMNDLRPDTEWRFSEGAIKQVYLNIKRDITGNDDSYFRRAVRSNELFFIIKISNLYDQKILNRITGKI